MATRRSNRLRVLGDAELMRAILSNEGRRETESDEEYSSEEGEVDEATDSEEDILEEATEDEDDAEEEADGGDVPMRPDKIFTGRDGTEWHAEPVAHQTTRFQNIFVRSRVMLPPGKHLDSMLDCFRVIFDDAVLDDIVRYTNIEA